MIERPRAPAGQAADEGEGARGTQGPRVAYVTSYFPKITETFVLYEMRALESLGAEVEVFPLLREPPGPRHPEAKRYESRAHFLPWLSGSVLAANWRRFAKDPGKYLGTWWHGVKGTCGSPKFLLGALACYPKCVVFAERAEQLGVDHIHAHFASHPALAALFIHRLTGIPFSFTAHGSDLHVDRHMLRAKVADAAFVVAVSSYNRDLILQECSGHYSDKVKVVHCGADPSVFWAPAGAHGNGKGNGNGSLPRGRTPVLRIACVASLEEVKGHRFLLQACRILADQNVDVLLELAGDGSLRADLERRIRDLSLDDRVRLRGSVPRGEVTEILARSDVAVLASYPTPSGRREGIPVALMEAMMSGLPVVASALSGIPELVDDGRTGYLVPPGDPWLLADRLAMLARSPEQRASMGAAARAKVLSDFDLTAGAQRLLACIRPSTMSRVDDT